MCVDEVPVDPGLRLRGQGVRVDLAGRNEHLMQCAAVLITVVVDRGELVVGSNHLELVERPRDGARRPDRRVGELLGGLGRGGRIDRLESRVLRALHAGEVVGAAGHRDVASVGHSEPTTTLSAAQPMKAAATGLHRLVPAVANRTTATAADAATRIQFAGSCAWMSA